MRRKILFAFAVSTFLFSCQTEQKSLQTKNDLQTSEMKAFNAAFKSLGSPQNRISPEERKSGSIELSDRRKRLLVPSSLDLIKSTGISDREIQQKTNGDITKIIVWAIQINLDKNRKIESSLKSEN
jgi:hypothetical protein